MSFIRLDFEKPKFDFFDFFHISIYFIVFFISFGAISLFPQEKISEGIIYYQRIKDNYAEKEKEEINPENKEDKEDKGEDNIENKEDTKENNKKNDKEENNKENKEDKKIGNKEEKKDKENKVNNKSQKNQEGDKGEKGNKRKKKRKKSKSIQNKDDVEIGIFLIINIGIILAYVLNKLFNYLFYQYSSELYNDNFELVFIIIYAGSYFISLIFYFLFHFQVMIIKQMEKEKEEEEEKIKQKFFRICGFLIYYEKTIVDNENKIEKIEENINHSVIKKYIIHDEDNKNDKTEDERLGNYTHSNRNNKNKLNKNNNTERNVIVVENNIENGSKDIKNMENYNDTINMENNDVIDNDIKINYLDIICSIIIPCYKYCTTEDKNCRYCCASCKLGCRKFYYYSVYSKYNTFKKIFEGCTCCICEECCSCCPILRICCCGCCECCDKLVLKEDYEEEEIFCYVYQTQRKCSWFCDLFFKNYMISLVIINIIFELQIIGFEKKLNENLETKSITENFKTIGVYLAFFGVFGLIFSLSCSESLRKRDINFFQCSTFFFTAINIILSGISSIGKYNLKKNIDNWWCLFSISCKKYFNFLLLDKLVNILDDENIDILSNSFIMTCIFFIYDIIIFLITELVELNSDSLILYQVIIGFIIFVLNLIFT